MEYSKYDKVNMDKADSSIILDYGFNTYLGNEQKIGEDR